MYLHTCCASAGHQGATAHPLGISAIVYIKVRSALQAFHGGVASSTSLDHQEPHVTRFFLDLFVYEGAPQISVHDSVAGWTFARSQLIRFQQVKCEVPPFLFCFFQLHTPDFKSYDTQCLRARFRVQLNPPAAIKRISCLENGWMNGWMKIPISMWQTD